MLLRHSRKNIVQFLVISALSIVCYYVVQIIRIQNRTKRVLLWWTPDFSPFEYTINCEGYSCEVTYNRNYGLTPNYSAIVFYGSHLKPWDLPVNKNVPWALYHEESPRNNAILLYNETQSLFDIIATFSRFSHFPLTLQYLPDISNLTDITFYSPTTTKNKLLNTLASVLYLQSDCDTPLPRDDYAIELQKYIKIDSYGACLNNRKLPKELRNIEPLDLYNPRILHFLSRYKFIIAFENAICSDYISEKLWRPLIVGSIPIYWGAPEIEDWLPNPKSAILVNNFDGPQALATYITKLNSDNELYESYLQHKIRRKITNPRLMMQTQNETRTGVGVNDFECYLCKSIHTQIPLQSKQIQMMYNCIQPKNSWETHWRVGKCQNEVLYKLRQNGTHFSKQDFDNKWYTYFTQNDC